MWISVKDAAEILNVTTGTVYRRIKAGDTGMVTERKRRSVKVWKPSLEPGWTKTETPGNTPADTPATEPDANAETIKEAQRVEADNRLSKALIESGRNAGILDSPKAIAQKISEYNAGIEANRIEAEKLVSERSTVAAEQGTVRA